MNKLTDAELTTLYNKYCKDIHFSQVDFGKFLSNRHCRNKETESLGFIELMFDFLAELKNYTDIQENP